jgi:undecaprenyl-diphosphatase
VLAVSARRPAFDLTVVTAATVWAADLVTLALKEIVGRPRPFQVLPEADPLLRVSFGGSFPSGHAATSFAGALVLSFLARRGVPALFVLAAAIAFSRVYVGAHYPLDVLAGALVGSFVGAGAIALAVRAPRPPSEAPRSSEETRPPG